jgi:hypothetical protein
MAHSLCFRQRKGHYVRFCASLRVKPAIHGCTGVRRSALIAESQNAAMGLIAMDRIPHQESQT